MISKRDSSKRQNIRHVRQTSIFKDLARHDLQKKLHTCTRSRQNGGSDDESPSMSMFDLSVPKHRKSRKKSQKDENTASQKNEKTADKLVSFAKEVEEKTGNSVNELNMSMFDLSVPKHRKSRKKSQKDENTASQKNEKTADKLVSFAKEVEEKTGNSVNELNMSMFDLSVPKHRKRRSKRSSKSLKKSQETAETAEELELVTVEDLVSLAKIADEKYKKALKIAKEKEVKLKAAIETHFKAYEKAEKAKKAAANYTMEEAKMNNNEVDEDAQPRLGPANADVYIHSLMNEAAKKAEEAVEEARETSNKANDKAQELKKKAQELKKKAQELKKKPDKANKQSRILSTVTDVNGDVYELGLLQWTTTVHEIKKILATNYSMEEACLTLYNKEDVTGCFMLKDAEDLLQVYKKCKNKKKKLNLDVLLSCKTNMVDWINEIEGRQGELPPSLSFSIKSKKICWNRFSPKSLLRPLGISTVPAHPNLVVITCFESHQVRVYATRYSGLEGVMTIMGSKVQVPNYMTGSRIGATRGNFRQPCGVVVTADSKYVIVAEHMPMALLFGYDDDETSGRLQLLRLTVPGRPAWGHGAELSGRVEKQFIGEGQLNYPYRIALRNVGDGGQTVLVSELHGHQVSEWTLDGRKIRTFGTGLEGSGDGELDMPCDMTVLPISGNIAIADTNNHRVSIFDGESARFLYCFGRDNFTSPCAIATDAYDHIIVLDDTNRLQIFEADGTHLCTRDDLGLSLGRKGLEWHGDNGGRLAIANGETNEVLFFISPYRSFLYFTKNFQKPINIPDGLADK